MSLPRVGVDLGRRGANTSLFYLQGYYTDIQSIKYIGLGLGFVGLSFVESILLCPRVET